MTWAGIAWAGIGWAGIGWAGTRTTRLREGHYLVSRAPPDYLDGARKLVAAEHWQAFEDQVSELYEQMARITIAPE